MSPCWIWENTFTIFNTQENAWMHIMKLKSMQICLKTHTKHTNVYLNPLKGSVMRDYHTDVVADNEMLSDHGAIFLHFWLIWYTLCHIVYNNFLKSKTNYHNFKEFIALLKKKSKYVFIFILLFSHFTLLAMFVPDELFYFVKLIRSPLWQASLTPQHSTKHI